MFNLFLSGNIVACVIPGVIFGVILSIICLSQDDGCLGNLIGIIVLIVVFCISVILAIIGILLGLKNGNTSMLIMGYITAGIAAASIISYIVYNLMNPS